MGTQIGGRGKKEFASWRPVLVSKRHSIQRRLVSELGHTTARREAAMALADSSDSSDSNLVERMIRVEDGLAYQMERSRAAFTAPNRRIAFAIDQFEQRLD